MTCMSSLILEIGIEENKTKQKKLVKWIKVATMNEQMCKLTKEKETFICKWSTVLSRGSQLTSGCQSVISDKEHASVTQLYVHDPHCRHTNCKLCAVLPWISWNSIFLFLLKKYVRSRNTRTWRWHSYRDKLQSSLICKVNFPKICTFPVISKQLLVALNYWQHSRMYSSAL
jgi:hypothetical protein